METPIAVANFFIQKGLIDLNPVTPMKVVKLAYIAHGWHLGLTGKPLLSEGVQAWKYGPVVPSLYHKLKEYKNNPVTQIQWEMQSPGYGVIFPTPAITSIPLLDKIWDEYKKFDGVQLSALTHQKGTPWYVVWEENGGKDLQGALIPDRLIEGYYKQRLISGGNA